MLRRIRHARRPLVTGAVICLLYILYVKFVRRSAEIVESPVVKDESTNVILHTLPLDQLEGISHYNLSKLQAINLNGSAPNPNTTSVVPGLSGNPAAVLDLARTNMWISQRLAETRAQCNKFKVPHPVDSELYLLPRENITYCKVPTAGDTYWDKVFSFLQTSPEELAKLGLRSPFQISKYDIQYLDNFRISRRHWKTDLHQMENSLKILFVRHPLERLWNSYMEKFFLVEFWSTLALQMATSGVEEKCPKSVTFLEFIQFTLPLYDENWAPVTQLCNPCTYQPHIIGHVETMREDTFYTLHQAKLDWVFADQEKISSADSEMMDHVVYNFQIHQALWEDFYKKCFTHKELAARLWKAFKKMGYMSSAATVPGSLQTYNQTTVLGELKQQLRVYSVEAASRRPQQLKVMKRDFESLPKPLMARVLEKYAMDFQLFGYSTELPSS